MNGGVENRPLPWQEGLWGGLSERLRGGRLPHALLFAGPRGLGKRHLAELFCRLLLCEAPQEGRPCGSCRGCTLLAAGSHPDFLAVTPEEEGKEITIGQVRGLIEQLALKSHYGRYKAVLVEPADRMNMNASNALLKTLEEPTPGTVLLLVTHQPSALLATIRSRCQPVLFGMPEREPTLAWLSRQSNSDPRQAALALALAGGAPLAALEWMEEGRMEQRAGLLTTLAQLRRGQADPVAVAARLSETDPRGSLERVHGFLGDLIRLRSGERVENLVNIDLADGLKGLAEAVDLPELFDHLDRLQAARRLLRGPANPQLLLEEWCVAWSEGPQVRRERG